MLRIWLVCNALMLFEALSLHHQLHWCYILISCYVDQASNVVNITSCQIFRYC